VSTFWILVEKNDYENGTVEMTETEATSLDDAETLAIEQCAGDHDVFCVAVYEVANWREVDLKPARARLEAEKAAKQKALRDQRDRAEYERLRAKFGGE